MTASDNPIQPQARGTALSHAGFAALLCLIALEVVLYPTIAGAYSYLRGKGPGAGSAIGYYRDVYVVPAAVVLSLGIGFLWLLGRARSAIARKLCAVGWILNGFLLVGSLWWYFRVIEAAGRVGR